MLVCGNCWAHLAGLVQAIVGVLFHAAAEYDGGQAQRRFERCCSAHCGCDRILVCAAGVTFGRLCCSAVMAVVVCCLGGAAAARSPSPCVTCYGGS